MWVGDDEGGAVCVGGDGVEQSEAGYPKVAIGMQVLNLSNFGLITFSGWIVILTSFEIFFDFYNIFTVTNFNECY